MEQLCRDENCGSMEAIVGFFTHGDAGVWDRNPLTDPRAGYLWNRLDVSYLSHERRADFLFFSQLRGQFGRSSMNPFPKISIITPSLNQAAYLEETLRSVRDQDYPAFEHIVVDGASTDGSVEILKQYSSQPGWTHLRWISEKDTGQSDALNKGFRLATGDIVGWLNSDDTYAKGCFREVARAFAAYSGVDVFYGDYNWIDERGNLLEVRREIEFSHFILLFNRVCYIQSSGALFLKRGIFQSGHFLDEQLNYSMDYEFYLRLLNNGYRFKHIGKVLGSFRWHSDSKTINFPGRQAMEINAARAKHAPYLKKMNAPAAKFVTAVFLGSVATMLRWGKKAASGYYFNQHRR